MLLLQRIVTDKDASLKARAHRGISPMARYSRILIALTILLSGLALIPRTGIFAGVVRWQRFAGGYEDVVTVTRARYRDGELEARAISSSGGLPTLSVYRTSDNSFIGNLIYDPSEGDHRADFPLGSNPQVITVRSSLGGESTVLVQDDSGVPVTVTPSVTPTAGNPTNTPTSIPPTNTATPGGPTLTPTASVTPGGPTLTPTASVTPGGPTLTPTASVTPGGPTLTPTATTVVQEPTVTPTATTPPGSNATLYLPLLYRAGQ